MPRERVRARAARPESWRRFVAGNPEALAAVATLAAWASGSRDGAHARVTAVGVVGACTSAARRRGRRRRPSRRSASGLRVERRGDELEGGNVPPRSSPSAVPRRARRRPRSPAAELPVRHRSSPGPISVTSSASSLGRRPAEVSRRGAPPPRARWRARPGARPRAARAFGARWRARRSRRGQAAWRRPARRRRSDRRRSRRRRARGARSLRRLHPASAVVAFGEDFAEVLSETSADRGRARRTTLARRRRDARDAPQRRRGRRAPRVGMRAMSSAAVGVRVATDPEVLRRRPRVMRGDAARAHVPAVRRRGDTVYAGFELERFGSRRTASRRPPTCGTRAFRRSREARLRGPEQHDAVTLSARAARTRAAARRACGASASSSPPTRTARTSPRSRRSCRSRSRRKRASRCLKPRLKPRAKTRRSRFPSNRFRKPVQIWTRLAVGEMDPDATEAEIAFPIAIDGVVAIAIPLWTRSTSSQTRARETPRCPAARGTSRTGTASARSATRTCISAAGAGTSTTSTRTRSCVTSAGTRDSRDWRFVARARDARGHIIRRRRARRRTPPRRTAPPAERGRRARTRVAGGGERGGEPRARTRVAGGGERGGEPRASRRSGAERPRRGTKPRASS